jgi:chlorobactene glucosyltransferase
MTTFVLSTVVVWALAALLPLVALLMTLFNLTTWPRGRRGTFFGARASSPGKKVSVLIPARNEESTIERCVRAVLEGSHSVHEVLVYDDQSTDQTPAILTRLGEEFDELRVVQAQELPTGWVGKPHACHRLSQAAGGEVLVFVDADTFLQDDGLERIASLFVGKQTDHTQADIVTAVPRQKNVGFLERLVLPLLHLTYTSWFPLMLVYKSQDPKFLAANGQLLAIDRSTYDDIGGFESVRDEVVDDMALCRRAKQAGHTVVFADGFDMATCRMYGSAGEVWQGFSKNLYEGVGARPGALLAVIVIYSVAFVVPYFALGAALIGVGGLLVPAIVGVGANVILRAVLAWRFHQPWEGIVLHPIGVLALLGIALNSFRWHMRDSIIWSGRSYARKSRRGEP